tara:strand:- start:114 stop:770 length:657 start_codon:yes stop_codon:yes gene_type:complete
MSRNPYQILRVNPNAKIEDIKKAYRDLVKIHHPDKGGDSKVMIKINEAWEILKKKHKNLNSNQCNNSKVYNQTKYRKETANYAKSEDVENWFQNIYLPIDKLLGQIINPLSSNIKDLSADPYDQSLMDSFCLYLDKSKNKIKKVKIIYTSIASPCLVKSFSLDLYHCLSQVEDGLNELERYTMGYVDNYLHDGKGMIAEATKLRKILHTQKKSYLSYK